MDETITSAWMFIKRRSRCRWLTAVGVVTRARLAKSPIHQRPWPACWPSFRSQRQHRILFVEDEALIRMVMAENLADQGFLIEEAGSATEAMERLHVLDGQIDGVVLDLGLPDRPCDFLASEICDLRPDLPIVVACGHSEEQMRSRFPDTERMAFVGKPYDTEALVQALKTLWAEGNIS
ncbi:putative transcriptional regulatory protein pdtaR [compost metagenome]